MTIIQTLGNWRVNIVVGYDEYNGDVKIYNIYIKKFIYYGNGKIGLSVNVLILELIKSLLKPSLNLANHSTIQ